MEINVFAPQKIDVKTVSVHVKVRDEGFYDLKDAKGNIIAKREQDYVPSMFPGEHFGDYLILDIDVETGKILNWKTPSEESICASFPTLRSNS